MPDVFISYSRKDKEFVARLQEALADHQRETWLDTKDIPPTAEWLQEIYEAIEAAEAFLFVISPDGVTSEICQMEIAHAIRHNKRLIPVVHREVETNHVPFDLGKVNWLFFRDHDDFEASFQSLIEALNTDLIWIRDHTRLLVKALEWNRKGRDRSFLLRGRDLKDAEAWLAQGGQKEPKPTEIQAEYIVSSHKSQTRRQRLTLGSISVGLIVAIFLSLLTLQQYRESNKSGQISLSRKLASQSQLLLTQHPDLLSTSVLLSLEAIKHWQTREGLQALAQSLRLLPEPVTEIEHSSLIPYVLSFSPDGKRLASCYEGCVLISETATGKNIKQLQMRSNLSMEYVAFSSNNKFLAGTARFFNINGAQLWDITSFKEIEWISNYSVFNLAFSPDSKWIALVMKSGEIQVREISTGKELLRLSKASVSSVNFSPDGHYFASEGKNIFYLWEFPTGREILRIALENNSLYEIVFSHDSKFVATSNSKGSITVWDVGTGKEVTQVEHEYVTNVTFSPTENVFATSGPNHIVRLWSLSGREILQLAHHGLVEKCGFSQDGRWLVTTCNDGTGRMWDLSTGEELVRLTHGKEEVTDCIISPDCKFIASSGKDGLVKIWKASSFWRGTLLEARETPYKVAFTPNMRYIVFNTYKPELRIFETDNWRQFLSLKAFWWDFNRDGKLLAFANKEVIKVIEMSTGKLVSLFRSEDEIASISFGPKANLLAVGYNNGTVQVLDVLSKLPVACLAHSTGGKLTLGYSFLDIVSLAFSPDGKLLATASKDHTVRLWETTNWKETQRLVFSDWVNAISFAPNSAWAAALINDGALSIFDPGTGKILANIKHEKGGVVERIYAGKFITAYAISPDSRLLGTVSNDHTARIWDPINGRELHQLLHEGSVKCLAFSPDGEWLATGGHDNICRIWSIDTGKEVYRFGHKNYVSSLAFSPDGAFLVSGSGDHTIGVWLWRPGDLIKQACTHLTRNLTLEEWRQYLPNEPYRATCPNLPVPEK
jgi:WD40 repeat protein